MKSFYKIKFKYPKQPRKYKEMYENLTQNELVQIYQDNPDGGGNVWMELIERNRGFFSRFIKRYPDEHQQDLYQQFTLIIQKKMKDFDLTLGFKFSTYLIWGLRGENSSFPRTTTLVTFPVFNSKKGTVLRMVSANSKINIGEDVSGEMLDILTPTPPPKHNNFMVKIYSKLNKRQRIIIKSIYEDGLSRKQISDLTGVTHQLVSREHNEILFFIKGMFEYEYSKDYAVSLENKTI